MAASTIDGSTGLLVVYNALNVRPGVFDGAATYSANVLRHLPALVPDGQVIVVCREGEDRFAPASNLELHRVKVGSARTRVVFESTRLGGLVSRLGADVFVSPHESMPLRLDVPAVVVAMNLAYHCELARSSFHGGTLRERAMSAAQRTYYRARMPRAYRHARVVVPISNTAADLLAAKAGLVRERALVVLAGSDSIFLPSQGPVPRRPATLLVVSAIAPYKNFEGAVDALARVRAQSVDAELLVAGGDWRGYRDVVEEHARRAGIRDHVHFLGPQTPAEVAALYASSSVLLHLSECEACPFPPLEAMRAGLPVVAARRSSIPEVVGDGAILVEPDDATGVADAVCDLLDDDEARAALVRRGHARAHELTWRATAEGLAEAIRRAAA